MKDWARAIGYAFSKCIVQAENLANIGWIVYSTQFTDIEYMKKYLQDQTRVLYPRVNVDWGFKITAVTKTDILKDGKNDTKTEWKDRRKALSVYVQAEKANIATTIISKIFETKGVLDVDSNTIEYKDIYLFTPPEHVIPPDNISNYKKLTNRQYFHTKKLNATITNEIEIDIDQPIRLKRGIYTTLRKMILSIKVKFPGTNYETRLFHSIDFCLDTRDMWMQGQRGPGGPGYIMTFYEPNEAEARRMTKGLGIYLKKRYGKKTITPLFSEDHWEATEGWKWDKQKNTFDTPENRQLKANVQLDPSGALMDMFEEEMMEEEETRQSEEEKNSEEEAEIELIGQATSERESEGERSKNKTSRAQKMNKHMNRWKEFEKVRRMQDTDLDSLDHQQGMVKSIEVDEEEDSIDSSVTMGTREINYNASIMKEIEEGENQPETSSIKSFQTMNEEYFKNLFKEDMTLDQKEKLAMASLNQTFRKLISSKQRMVSELIQKEHNNNNIIEEEQTRTEEDKDRYKGFPPTTSTKMRQQVTENLNKKMNQPISQSQQSNSSSQNNQSSSEEDLKESASNSDTGDEK